jgi:hypothetical protein
MTWGSLFEPIHRIYMEQQLRSDIYVLGSVPHRNISCHKYSPDGLCVTKGSNIKRLCSYNDSSEVLKLINNDDEYMVLLEQKSPACRFIKYKSKMTIP